jgi:hypothetical protein
MSISEQELQTIIQELKNYRANVAASMMRIREIEQFLESRLPQKQQQS